jgi:hypothetical protein
MKISFTEWNEKSKFYLSRKDVVFIDCKNCLKEHYKEGYKTYFKWKDKEIPQDVLTLCPSCYRRKDKNGKILPNDVYDELKKNGFVFFETFLRHKEYNSKIKIQCVCESCNIIFYKRWDKVKGTLSHNHIREKQYCKKCIMKEITRSKEWREKNSLAQLISQNRQEVKKKNSDGVKNAHLKDPTIKKRMSEAATKNWQNPEYAEKIIKNSKTGFLSGIMDGIYFSSSYELSFILYCIENSMSIKRCDYIVRYKDSCKKNRIYLPDFIINDKTIYEIKGGLTRNVLQKKNAAIEFFSKKNIKYEILFLEDLIKMKCKMIKNIYEIKEIKKQYEQRIKFYRIPKTWKTSFIKNCRKKRLYIQRESL